MFSDAVNGYKDIFSKGMEVDIFIPSLKIGIEYDGVYWHHKKKQITYEREQRKYDICKENGIYLIRVREQKKYEDEKLAADWCLFLPNDKLSDEDFNTAITDVIKKIISERKLNGNYNLKIDIAKDRFEILSYLQEPVKNSVQELASELVKEWDYEQNGNLKPDMIAAGSSQSVNWICSKCGYKWEAPIYHRAKSHTGCPKCAGMVFEKGINDLKTRNPELLIDWDYDENCKIGVLPDEVMYNSGKKCIGNVMFVVISGLPM